MGRGSGRMIGGWGLRIQGGDGVEDWFGMKV